MNKKIISIGVIALAVIAAGIHLSQGSAIEVETLVIKPSIFQDKIEEDGEVVSNKDQAIFSELSGVVATVHVSEGDMVSDGDLLFTLDTKDLEIELEGLKGQLIRVQGNLSGSSDLSNNAGIKAQKTLVDNAEYNYTQLKKDYERIKALYEAGGMSQSNHESAQLAMETAKQTLFRERASLTNLQATSKGRQLEIQSAIEKLEHQVSKSTISAKSSGYLTDFELLTGDAVEAMATLGHILDAEKERIEVMLLADKAYGISIGDHVIITRDRGGIDDYLKGQVVYIGPNAVEEVSSLGLKEKRVKVEIELSETVEPALILGSEVQVEFITHQIDQAIMVPKTAVFYSDNGDAVWLANDGIISLKPVEIGYENSRQVEIKSGLVNGDRIIRYYDEDDIEEGVAIK